MSGGRFRGAKPGLAYVITTPGLLGCVALALLSPHAELASPLTWALAACAIGASTAHVPLGGKLLIDASFVPLLLAIAFLGPTATFVIVAASEFGAWTIQRYRFAVVPLNILAVGGIAMLGAAWFEALQLDPGPMFFGALAVTGALTLFVNDLLITGLVGVLDGAPVRARLRAHVDLIPALAINVALGVGAATVYSSAGFEAVVLVCGLIVGFNYMVRQTLLAREHAGRSDELAASRARLLTQTLNTEARERRTLAESLHDGALQTVLAAGQDLAEAQRGDRSALAHASDAIEQTERQLRAAVFELHPTVLERAGLAKALEQVAAGASRRAGLDYAVSVDKEAEGLDDRLTISIVRELIGNVAKHAHATTLEVSVAREARGLAIRVSDDGQGFDPARRQSAIASGHVGLASCVDRCEARNGSLTVDSEPRRGTTVEALIPILEAELSAPEVGDSL